MGPIAPAFALRRALAKGCNRRDFAGDILAVLVGGVVALPLSMALAIASGVPPQHGLYTAIAGGAIIAALGGSKVQVSGPTAAFVVILAPISAAHGLAGLMLASILAGIILIVMGIARMGRMIEFIPYPVTSGFTAGIALVIATIQLKDFLGLTDDKVPEQYIERIAVLAGSLPTIRWPGVTVSFMKLAILKLWPRINKRIPSPIVALPTMALLAFIVRRYWPKLSVATINTRFHGWIPQLLPLPRWPGVQVLTEDHPDFKEPLPPGILLYRFAGPLFFGAAQKALSQLHTVDERVRVILLDLTEVPTMDATGLVNLESALQQVHAQDIIVVIAGARDDCLRLMAAAGWKHRDWLVIWRSFEDALALARTLAGSDLGTTPARSG